MSFYGAMFGQNPMADVVLATLGLTRNDVGRFRDCFVADGEIAVYTRNGGGNRHCWCADDPKHGRPECKHYTEVEIVDEWVEMPEAEAKATGKQLGAHIYHGNAAFRGVKTGRKVERINYVCEEPESSACACPGCTIEHRLPKHPNYLRDKDDDFDCTYATIYFSFPAEYADALNAIDQGTPFDPDARWETLLQGLKGQAQAR